MRRIPLAIGLAGLLLASAPEHARAQIQLHVSDCDGGSAIVNNCSSNNGSIRLVGSLVLPFTIPEATGMTGEVALLECPGAPAIPDWWQFQSGACREGALSASYDFTALDGSGYPVLGNCLDPWAGTATGSVGYDIRSAVEADIHLSCALSAPRAIDATSSEYYLFVIQISKAGTVAACRDCSAPIALYFRSLTITQSAGAPGGDVVLAGDGVGQWAYYNTGVGPGGQTPPPDCTIYSDPVHRSSWGSIKAIYR